MKTAHSLKLPVALLGAFVALGAPVAALGQSEAEPNTGGSEAGDPAAVALHAQPATLLGRTLHFRGRLGAQNAGRNVTVERLRRTTGEWVTIAGAQIDQRGQFIARWRTDRSGRFTTRAVIRHQSSAGAASSFPTVDVTVLRPARATWYGPGFYGNRMACGHKLTRSTLGVAHRTLPCGTLVDISYHGRSIRVPVVDRGPYGHGADWDLTKATATALHFTYTDRIGALAVPGSARASR